MPTPLDDYKEVIDAVAKFLPCVSAEWVRENGPWPKLPENKSINTFVSSLTAKQRGVLADLLQKAFDEGVHRLLAYLNDEIALHGLRITRNGRELPVQPFGSELYYDWIARRFGDDWPDPVDETLT